MICMQGVVPVHHQLRPAMSPPPSASEPLVRRRPRSALRARFIRQRELGGSSAPPPAVLSWIEGETLRKLDTGTYVDLRRTSHLVRSTISIAFSHDGRFFASTHGDHSVKIFDYPALTLICSLDGHPRTPWSVRFHPHNSAILASGCLGGECRVWHLPQRRTIHKHVFSSKISCVAFSPSGEFLAVTCGRQLQLWNYAEPRSATCIRRSVDIALNAPDPRPPAGPAAASAMPMQLLGGNREFHMVDFHPSGDWLITGESNRMVLAPGFEPLAPPPEEQFTLKLVVHRFDRRLGVSFARPVLIVPRAVAYNDAGVHISPCGTMLAACIPVTRESEHFQIAVIALTDTPERPIGTILYRAPLDHGHVVALTNLKFSRTSKHLLAGFSFPRGNPVLRTHAQQYDGNANRNFADGGALEPRLAPCGAPMHSPHPQVRVVDIYRVSDSFPLIRSLGADLYINDHNVGGAEDEINVAVFAPGRGVSDGILYGTQKGRIRMFHPSSGRKSLPPGICDENCNFRKLHSLQNMLNPPFPPLTAVPVVAVPAVPIAAVPVAMPVPAATWARYAAFAAAAAANTPTAPVHMPMYGIYPVVVAPVPRITLPMPPPHPYAAPLNVLAGEFRAQDLENVARYSQPAPAPGPATAQRRAAVAGTPTHGTPAVPPIILERQAQSRPRQDQQ